MCMVVYLAADRRVPLIPWDEKAPGFNVAELEPRDEAVCRHLSRRHVYRAGAHTLCGCGFRYGRPPLASQAEEAAGRESVRALAAYLARAVRAGPVEVYACWEGEQGEEPVGRRRVTPAFFRGDGFEFVERELLVVERR